MQIEHIFQNGQTIASVSSDGVLIADAQSALDLMMAVQFETGCKNIILSKQAICEDFFILSTRLAGEILQKYANYGARLAIYGDFSHYTSKPLQDFIRESNRGHCAYFLNSKDAAIERLSQA